VALRELRVFLPADCEEEVEELLNELDLKQLWKGHDKEGTGLMLILAFDAFKAEKIVGKFEERFGQGERLRMVLSEAVASFPPIPMDEDEKKDEDANGDENNEPENGDEDEDEENPGRVIIEELLEDIRPSIAFDGQFMAMVILSAIVAAIGLIRDNTPVVIGAMVRLLTVIFSWLLPRGRLARYLLPAGPQARWWGLWWPWPSSLRWWQAGYCSAPGTGCMPILRSCSRWPTSSP
jgi:hypothetical protein